MSTDDPWASAGANQQGGGQPPAGSTQAVVDREKEFRALGGGNPFATPDQVLGGGGMRGPQWPDLLDRLVVLKPLEKKVGQPVPNQPEQKQDFYSCELTVLTGGPLTIITPAKEAQGSNPALPEQQTEHELPATFPNWWAYGRAVTVKLDNLGAAPLYLGVVKRCPTGPGYRKGETWEDATREWDAYVERMRKDPARAGAKPQFSWGLIDPTPEQQALALDWWNSKQ